MNSKILSTLYVFILFSAELAFSQSFSSRNALPANFEKAKLFLSQNQFDSAANLSLKISSYALEQKLWVEFMEGSTLAVRALTRLGLYDSAYHVAQLAYDKSKPHGHLNHRKFADLARQYFATIHFAGITDYNIVLIREMKAYLSFIKTIPVKERFVDSLKYKTFDQLGS